MNTLTSWVIALAIGVLTAVAGAFAVGFLANLCVRWYRISSFEGGSGYYVVGLGILGAVGGLIIGVVCARVVMEGANAHFARGLGLGLVWTLGLTLAVGLIARLAADLPPRIEGRKLELEVEVRLASGSPRPAKREDFTPSMSLLKGRSQHGGSGDVQWDSIRQEEGRWILPAIVSLETRSADKTLYVSIDKAISLHFGIDLPGQPGREHFGWTGWKDVGAIYDNGTWTNPVAGSSHSLRFRVREEVSPPPAPSREDVEKAARELDQAEVGRLAPSAPIREWLRFTRPGTEDESLKKAITHITARGTFIPELAVLMRDDDAAVAADSLRLVSQLPDPTAALVPPVAEAGRDLVTRLEKVVRLTPEQDPSYEAAAEIATRFLGWIEAARTLHDRCGGDLSAELRALLTLARQRPDSQVLRGDLVRISSFYLQEWTGEAPLPTDPPPR